MRHSFNLVNQAAVRVSGLLNVETFRRCLKVLVQRHESLRTRIVLVEGVAKQQIEESHECVLDIADLAKGSKNEAENEARRQVAKFFHEEINPKSDPLFQLRLLKLDERDYVLAIAIHHLVSDGMTLALLLHELRTVYEDFADGRECSLPAVPLQYADYAIWQRNSREFWQKKNENYWSERIAGAKRTEFPFDDGLKDIAPYTAAALQISFDKTLSDALNDLARSERTSRAFILLAVCVAVFSRWCKQESFGLLSIVSGRDSPDLNCMLGFLAQTSYLRIDLCGCETFSDVVRVVLREFLDGWAHLECGIVLREELKTTIDIGPVALFQWLPWDHDGTFHLDPVYTQRNTSMDTAIAIEAFPVETQPGFFGKALTALQLNLYESAQGIRVSGYYRADYFKPDTMERFMGNLRGFCELIALNPQSRLASFERDELSTPPTIVG